MDKYEILTYGLKYGMSMTMLAQLNEELTSSEDAFPSATRETGREIGFVWRLVIAEAHVAVYPMNKVLWR